MKYDKQAIGKRIKEERIAAGFKTQGQFAEKMNYSFGSRQTVARWESGKVLPCLDDLLKMCEIFNCELGYLLCEYDCKKHEPVIENCYMMLAVLQAQYGIVNGEGGPFGAVIVRNDVVIGSGHNRVLLNHDPTCHGEIEAIRDACKRTGSFDLSGCDLYTTAEPCPMCLAAAMWANIEHIYYGCSKAETADIGFRDDLFYQKLNLNLVDSEYVQQIESPACHDLFTSYSQMDHKLY